MLCTPIIHGTFQEDSLIILSLFANLKYVSTFYSHETLLVYKLKTFKNCKEVKRIIKKKIFWSLFMDGVQLPQG